MNKRKKGRKVALVAGLALVVLSVVTIQLPTAASATLSTPFDFNGNGNLDILDVIDYLDFYFRSDPPRLPCGANGTIHEPDNITFFDSNGDGELDLADAVHIMLYIFLDGKPHASGEDCQALGNCPDSCGDA